MKASKWGRTPLGFRPLGRKEGTLISEGDLDAMSDQTYSEGARDENKALIWLGNDLDVPQERGRTPPIHPVLRRFRVLRGAARISEAMQVRMAAAESTTAAGAVGRAGGRGCGRGRGRGRLDAVAPSPGPRHRKQGLPLTPPSIPRPIRPRLRRFQVLPHRRRHFLGVLPQHVGRVKVGITGRPPSISSRCHWSRRLVMPVVMPTSSRRGVQPRVTMTLGWISSIYHFR